MKYFILSGEIHKLDMQQKNYLMMYMKCGAYPKKEWSTFPMANPTPSVSPTLLS